MKISHIVGARPNFVKVAPVMEALSSVSHITQTLIHTGQHLSDQMSSVFFTELGIARPDHNLACGGQLSLSEMTRRLFDVLVKEKPGCVVVYGDVTSTLAGALAARMCNVPVAHVEAGLRSFNVSMLEEINRFATDHLCQLRFAASDFDCENLQAEGLDSHLVGNVMVDTLSKHITKARTRQPDLLKSLDLKERGFVLLTLHRPSNVDKASDLFAILSLMNNLAEKVPVVFPVHPRTESKSVSHHERLKTLPPLGYLDFIALLDACAFVVTDSGGIQEESSWLGIPCLTLRDETERPVTTHLGTNRLVGTNPKQIQTALERALEEARGDNRKTVHIPLWDGKSANRIASILANWHP